MIIMMSHLPSQVMTTSDDKVSMMTIRGFHWLLTPVSAPNLVDTINGSNNKVLWLLKWKIEEILFTISHISAPPHALTETQELSWQLLCHRWQWRKFSQVLLLTLLTHSLTHSLNNHYPLSLLFPWDWYHRNSVHSYSSGGWFSSNYFLQSVFLHGIDKRPNLRLDYDRLLGSEIAEWDFVRIYDIYITGVITKGHVPSL